ncbi:glycoside hydrolase family 32 protein [Marinobacterium sp. D7]|uniref:glycoside hydrolase family 32 protein n=1 Tax=Marinobacterium ramblicola TaxID=2849041 RepID=UPI001C2D31AF|nr:glycoside hydrolase family 32 protein [Marinobacterium ramblicola]MBV1787625.1 glycoside hydrolase family 32 protein [Marinobacterium ramblicola]
MTLAAIPAAPAVTPVRPTLHFTPPQGWMNDPNGLVYFDGEYHLFYQYHPHGLEWGPMHWGHAVSRDLLHWQHLDTALFPDEEGMCFSGSAIVDHDDSSGLFDGKPGLLAFYTAHRVTGEGPQDYVQEQCIAYSRDRGRSWTKYAGNPIIAPPGFRDFRDPKVIRHADSSAWVMALACGQSIRFYRSENLLDWTLASEFGEGQGRHTPGPWECPDLFELPVIGGEGSGEKSSRWVLVVGVGAGDDSWGSFTQYFVGDFDGHTFHNDNAPEQVLLMDESRDFYATQSWSDTPDGRRIAISWLNNWLYANQIPENGWRGAMSLPRELRLVATDQGVRLAQRFAAELKTVLDPTPQRAEASLLSRGDQLQLTTRPGPTLGRLNLRLAPESQVELSLLPSGLPELTLQRNDQGLSLRHRRQGENGNEKFDRYYPHDFILALGEGDAVQLEWFIEHGSLELLVNDGLYSLTCIQFDTLLDPAGQGPVLTVKEGEVLVDRLESQALKA